MNFTYGPDELEDLEDFCDESDFYFQNHNEHPDSQPRDTDTYSEEIRTISEL